MPEPKPKDEEQYGPPLPPTAQRQWRIPSTTETMARDMGLGGAYDALRKGEVVVPEWLKRLDPLQGARDLTGWELPTSDDVVARTGPERAVRAEIRSLKKQLGQWPGLPPALESLPGDMLSMFKLNPIIPEELTPEGSDPLQDAANLYNDTRRQPDQQPRQGRTVTAEEQKSYIDWDGSVGVTR